MSKQNQVITNFLGPGGFHTEINKNHEILIMSQIIIRFGLFFFLSRSLLKENNWMRWLLLKQVGTLFLRFKISDWLRFWNCCCSVSYQLWQQICPTETSMASTLIPFSHVRNLSKQSFGPAVCFQNLTFTRSRALSGAQSGHKQRRAFAQRFPRTAPAPAPALPAPDVDGAGQVRAALLDGLAQPRQRHIRTLRRTATCRDRPRRGHPSSRPSPGPGPTCSSGSSRRLRRRRSSRPSCAPARPSSLSSTSSAILCGVTQSRTPNTFACTTPFVSIGLKYRLSCTLAMAAPGPPARRPGNRARPPRRPITAPAAGSRPEPRPIRGGTVRRHGGAARAGRARERRSRAGRVPRAGPGCSRAPAGTEMDGPRLGIAGEWAALGQLQPWGVIC